MRILCSGLFSHQVKFYSFIFLHKISTWVVCVNGKHPYDILGSIAGQSLSLLPSKVTWRDYGANGRNATLLMANNSQHCGCYMLRPFAHLVACYWKLLGKV